MLTEGQTYKMPGGEKVKCVLVNSCRARVRYLEPKIINIKGREIKTYPETDICPDSPLELA
jgi:uncharacterized cupin superfamily protein